MQNSLADSLAAIVSEFVDQLTKAIEEEATMHARAAALSVVGGPPLPSAARAARSITGFSKGSAKGSAKAPVNRAVTRAAPPLRPAMAKGQKRDPEVIAATTERLATHIAKHPGQRMEEIAKALGMVTKDLALPIKRLIADKRITTRGQKRATRYS